MKTLQALIVLFLVVFLSGCNQAEKARLQAEIAACAKARVEYERLSAELTQTLLRMSELKEASDAAKAEVRRQEALLESRQTSKELRRISSSIEDLDFHQRMQELTRPTR